MIHLAGGWGWRRVYRKKQYNYRLCAWRLALDARRCAHIRIILKWSSAPFAHFLTPEYRSYVGEDLPCKSVHQLTIPDAMSHDLCYRVYIPSLSVLWAQVYLLYSCFVFAFELITLAYS
jgi:hypothetical protein